MKVVTSWCLHMSFTPRKGHMTEVCTVIHYIKREILSTDLISQLFVNESLNLPYTYHTFFSFCNINIFANYIKMYFCRFWQWLPPSCTAFSHLLVEVSLIRRKSCISHKCVMLLPPAICNKHVSGCEKETLWEQNHTRGLLGKNITMALFSFTCNTAPGHYADYNHFHHSTVFMQTWKTNRSIQ